MLRKILPAGFILALFSAPIVLLTDAPFERLTQKIGNLEPETQTPQGSAAPPGGPRLDPFSQVRGPFAISQTDADRASWSWSKAKGLAVDVWESQITSTGRMSSFYCGCTVSRRGATGGDIDFASCGYNPRSNETRAARLEWEHVVPAAFIGRGRACWTSGAPQCVDGEGRPFKGRDCCEIADPAFIMAASDPVNLVPSVGEVNGDRLDYLFGMIDGEARNYGQCDMEIDTARDIAEPPAFRRGDIGRIWAYMSKAYGLALPRDRAELYRDWILQDPVSREEILINQAISRKGHRPNPFVLQPNGATGASN